MLFVTTILLIGLLLGWGFGGNLRNLALARISLWYLAPLGLVLQAVPVRAGQGTTRLLPLWLLMASYALLITLAVANWRLRGFVLILVGLTLNATMIGLNQGMPVSPTAAARAGGMEAVSAIPPERGSKHHLAGEEDVLTPLGDSIGVAPPFGLVVSPGDVAMYVGAAMFLTAAMIGRPVRRRREEPPARPATPSGTRR